MSGLFQVFQIAPTGEYVLAKARIVAKNGQLSDWSTWHYVQAGDTTAPAVPAAASIAYTNPVGAMQFRLTDAYIATIESDVVAWRWYVQSRTGSGALAFDNAWTPTAIVERDVYTFSFPVAYASTTYYHIWCVPVDVLGNYDTTPGAAQHQNKQPGAVTITDLPNASQEWQFTGLFSSSDNDTVAWGSGTLTLANGSTYSIDAGNTGDMAARTWIYFDSAVSSTVLQTTTTAATAVGATKIKLAVALNNATAGKAAIYQVFNGSGGFSAEITTSQLNFTPLISAGGTGAIVATINATAEGIRISAGLLEISGSTSFSAGYDPTTKLTATGGAYNTAASGARVRIFPDANTGIQAIDDAANDVFKVIVGGTDVGDVIVGDLTGNYLQWDKSAADLIISGSTFTMTGTAGYIQTYASGDYNYIIFSTPAGGSDANVITMYNLLDSGGDRNTAYLGLDQLIHSTGEQLNQILFNPNNSGNSSISMVAKSGAGATQYVGYIQQIGANLDISTGTGDIIIDPAGGDVDFDACDIAVDAGRKINIEGTAGDTYMVYQNSRIEFFLNGTLEGYINSTGFVNA